MTPFKRFIKLLDMDRKDLIYLYTYAVLQGVIYLSIPLGIQATLGLVLAGRLSSSWFILTILVTIGVVVSGIFQLMQLYVVEVIQRRIFTRASFDFAERIPNFHINSLHSYYPPEIINRFFDIVGIQKGLPKILIDFTSSTLQIIVGLILLSIYHPVFVGFSILLVLIIFIIIKVLFEKGLQTSIQESNHKYQMAHWLIELARKINIFKLNTSELRYKKVNKINNNYLNARIAHFNILMKQYISIIALKALIIATLLIIGALLLLNNSITIGQFVAAEIIIILIITSAEKLIISLESVYEILTSVDKVGKVVEVPLDKQNEENVPLPSNGPLQITLDGLQVLLKNNEPLFKEKLTVQIEPREQVVFYGPPGSGKSALLKIITTLTDNYSGLIKFNNVSLKNLKATSVRGEIGVIFEDNSLFFGSILENITLGAEYPIDEVQLLCHQLGLSQFIDSLPNNFLEVIANSEALISNTNRARICIARALIKKPNLLLIEDVFSNLPETEGASLLRFVESYAEKTTTLWFVNPSLLSNKNITVINL